MNRIELVQALIDKKNYKTYLEIGVEKGISFHPIKCEQKIAVDPKFRIPFYQKWIWNSKNPTNKKNQYIEKTSDDFFAQDASKFFDSNSLDISFVDGLHTFEAALLDVFNSLKYLSEDGIVVMHDCMPISKACETPARSYEDAIKIDPPGWEGYWTGDVWKVIHYIREIHSEDLEAFVFDNDFGLGIVIPKNAKRNFEIDKEAFNKILELDYDYLMSDVENIIGLKPIPEMKKFVEGF